MAYSEELAGRLRDLLADKPQVIEKKMFGGLAFLLHGHLLVGVRHNELIARIGPDRYPAALQQPHVVEFDITGKPMKGWVTVQPRGLRSEPQLQNWLQQSLEFVRTLPPK
jgi:TfoX/Sxy family transcriptional regulator of competence genes